MDGGIAIRYRLDEPTWGSATYSFRSGPLDKVQTIRVLFIQPPITITNRQGAVVSRLKAPIPYVFLYQVDVSRNHAVVVARTRETA